MVFWFLVFFFFFQNHTKLERTCASLFQNTILLNLLVQPSVFMNTNFQYRPYKKNYDLF